MQDVFVRVYCDVSCKWISGNPRYRFFINDELFAERSWAFKHAYLEECFQVSAPGGRYPIRFESVDSDDGKFKVKNFRVEGPGRVVETKDGFELEVLA